MKLYNLSFVCLVGSALAANVLATSSNDNDLQQRNAEPVNLTAQRITYIIRLIV
jgi:hypothetical protein